MPVPVNHVGMSDIQTEYGGSSEISLTEYYRGDQYVPINQKQSAHGAGPIPLVSGGKSQEISIGMFRGTAKWFEWTFDFTQDRYNNFNLRNELLAVGWTGDVPIKVILNIFSGVHLVSHSVGVPTIDASAAFDPISSMTINNNGAILGRGGKGGNAGLYPNIPPSNGQNGGDAISTSLYTTIYNNGVISGGGGGGGATSSHTSPQVVPGGGETNFGRVRRINGASGGGGAPLGGHGDISTAIQVGFDEIYKSGAPNAGYSFSGFDLSSPDVFQMTPPTGASILNPGTGSSFPSTSFSHPHQIVGPAGGNWGDSGEPGHNYGGYDSIGDGRYVMANELPSADGGLPGAPVIGGQNVVWSKFGTVRGRFDFPMGVLWNPSSQNVLSFLSPNSDRTNNKSFSATNISHFRGSRTFNGPNEFGQWTNSVPSFYSYNRRTNLTNYGQNSSFDPSGSPIYQIVYATVVESPTAALVFLEGVVDDRVGFISVNGVVMNVSAPLDYTSIKQSGTFSIPSGPSVIKVGIIDDNGGSRSVFGNAHMFRLTVKSTPYAQILVDVDKWIVDSVVDY